VIDPIEIVESEAELSPGETLLLYTDGVPEAGRSSGQLGERGLMELCRTLPSLALPALLRRIEQAALERSGGRLRDDIALLAVRAS
jgi:sigma-B regulation protein RsbU (phosphoserine phosphatase)